MTNIHAECRYVFLVSA